MRISYWSSDVCSSDLFACDRHVLRDAGDQRRREEAAAQCMRRAAGHHARAMRHRVGDVFAHLGHGLVVDQRPDLGTLLVAGRSEEHTSELQSLMRNSYAVFCLKKTNNLISSRH